jgi:hypothetical protein
MIFRRNSLPKPPRPEAIARSQPAGRAEAEILLAELGQERERLIRQRLDLRQQIGALDLRAEALAFDICDDTDESQDVERYDGTLGVDIELVRRCSPAVGQLQWLDDLPERFTQQGSSVGDVNGARWASGAMISETRFLTTGHSFNLFQVTDWQPPRRNWQIIDPYEAATLMKANFNYQIDAATGRVRVEDSFPILRLLEIGSRFDYAIAELGRNRTGDTPGRKYGFLNFARRDSLLRGEMLCVIQHPDGRPKKIEAGPLLDIVERQIRYDSIDTQGGSSGSPVLSSAGEIVGVHSNGGCTNFVNPYNYGVSIGGIREESSIL